MSASRVASVLKGVVGRLSRAVDLGARESARRYRRAVRHLDSGRRALVDVDSRGLGGTLAPGMLHGRPWVYRPSAAEAAMAGRRMVEPVEFTGKMVFDVLEARGIVRKMRSDDGALNIYKPTRGELTENVEWYWETRGAQTNREIAAYRFDEILGFGRIPPTARTQGVAGDDKTSGPGMIQQFVESTESRDVVDYPRAQRHQLAVLDYVMGNRDRHWANFRTVERDGQPEIVAIDHGWCFPITEGPFEVPTKSPFVIERLIDDGPLDPDVLAAVRAVDTDKLRAAWDDAGLEPGAINGAFARLAKVQELGDIPKDARWDF
ncbi:hypothetical protein [Nocardia sp. CA-290969]|uniref:hypothetical protein n=1 Tax=Nocardia sp. CA-290969 TaxID=3239986 RepID=UPI003D9400AB